MMTGQILSGSDPAQAARYQIIIMFLLGACGSTAAVVSVYAAVAHVVDSCHRLRPERLIQRAGKGGVNGFLGKAAGQVSG
jgi:putative ABC transport system permease protein